jgi:hypothetical protein
MNSGLGLQVMVIMEGYIYDHGVGIN